jgi:hypothetical protein
MKLIKRFDMNMERALARWRSKKSHKRTKGGKVTEGRSLFTQRVT